MDKPNPPTNDDDVTPHNINHAIHLSRCPCDHHCFVQRFLMHPRQREAKFFVNRGYTCSTKHSAMPTFYNSLSYVSFFGGVLNLVFE